MKKSDLKDGMIVEYRKRECGDDRYNIVLNNRFVSLQGWMKFEDYNEDLTFEGSYSSDRNWDIVKVYKPKKLNSLQEIYEDDLELIWEREKEIDWSKVPKWTKVQVRDEDSREWKNRYFLRFEDEEYTAYPYYVTHLSEFIDSKGEERGFYKQCRLHESVEPKKEWYAE